MLLSKVDEASLDKECGKDHDLDQVAKCRTAEANYKLI